MQWRRGDSPGTAAYPSSQYTMNASSRIVTPSSQGNREAFFSHGSRDDRDWHPPSAPMRSMSLVTPEELPPHYQARFFQQPPIPDRRVADPPVNHTVYGHAAQDMSISSPYSTTNASPLDQQARSVHSVGFNFPQWGAYSQHSPQLMESGVDGFPREWYTGSPNLAQVSEEDSNSHHYQPPSRTSYQRGNPG